MARNQTDTAKSTVVPKLPEGREEQLSLFSPEALSAIRRRG